MTETNIHKSNSTYAALIIFALFLGLIAGYFLPPEIMDYGIRPIAGILTRILLYLTIPYFIFSIIITTYNLSNQGLFRGLMFRSILGGLVFLVALTLVSMIIFLFVPFTSTVPFITEQEGFQPLDFAGIISILFPHNFLETLSSSSTSMASILIAACLIGSMSVGIISRGNVLFDSIDALRRITMRILRTLLPFYSICVFFNIAVVSFTFTNFDLIALFGNLFLFLLVALLVLLLVICPIFLHIFHVPISYKLWCRQILPAIFTAVATTNVLASGALLLHVEEHGYTRKKINDMCVHFSLVFARAGTAMTLALSFLAIFKIYSSIPISISFFFLVLLGSIAFAYISTAYIRSIFILAIASLAQLSSVNIQEFYTVIIPVHIVLTAFAAGIDALSCTFVQLIISHSIKKSSYNKIAKTENPVVPVKELKQ